MSFANVRSSQIGSKTRYLPKVSKFLEKKDISVIRLENVIFGVYVYYTDQIIIQMGEPDGIESNLDMQKCTNS